MHLGYAKIMYPLLINITCPKVWRRTATLLFTTGRFWKIYPPFQRSYARRHFCVLQSSKSVISILVASVKNLRITLYPGHFYSLNPFHWLIETICELPEFQTGFVDKRKKQIMFTLPIRKQGIRLLFSMYVSMNKYNCIHFLIMSTVTLILVLLNYFRNTKQK